MQTTVTQITRAAAAMITMATNTANKINTTYYSIIKLITDKYYLIASRFSVYVNDMIRFKSWKTVINSTPFNESSSFNDSLTKPTVPASEK